jgi:hypothetical protein
MMEEEATETGVMEEGQQVSFRRIEELEQYGIAKTDITKLKHAGFHTIESVSRLFVDLFFKKIIYICHFRNPSLCHLSFIQLNNICRLLMQLLENLVKLKVLVSKK